MLAAFGSGVGREYFQKWKVFAGKPRGGLLWEEKMLGLRFIMHFMYVEFEKFSGAYRKHVKVLSKSTIKRGGCISSPLNLKTVLELCI